MLDVKRHQNLERLRALGLDDLTIGSSLDKELAENWELMKHNPAELALTLKDPRIESNHLRALATLASEFKPDIFEQHFLNHPKADDVFRDWYLDNFLQGSHWATHGDKVFCHKDTPIDILQKVVENSVDNDQGHCGWLADHRLPADFIRRMMAKVVQKSNNIHELKAIARNPNITIQDYDQIRHLLPKEREEGLPMG